MTIAIRNTDPTLTEAARRNRVTATAVDAGSGSYLTVAAALATYLRITTAAATYLTQTAAAATYLTSAGAVSTYLSIASGNLIYLHSASAAATYVPYSQGGTEYLRPDTGNIPVTTELMMDGQQKVYFQSSTNFIYGYTTSELHLACQGAMGLVSNTLNIGRAASANITLNFDTSTVDGKIVWQQAQNKFVVSNDVKISSSYLTVGKVYHAYGGFQQQTTTILCTQNVWSHVTNSAGNLWIGLEADSMTLTNDVMTITNAGDYAGALSMAVSGANGDDYFIRCYNLTQSAQMGYIIGGTTTGANNYQVLALPLYLECDAGDQLRMEIENTSNNNDPMVRSVVFYLTYLHDHA